MEEYIKEKLKRLIALSNKKGVEDFSSFTGSEICKNCWQSDCCCNKYPCIFAPSDFLDITDIEYMKKILDTGLVCVSEARSGFLTLRPVGKREIYSEPRYQNNTCIFYHYHSGCMLDACYRPTQGLLLIPDKYHRCECLYTKDNIYEDYKNYQDILRELYEYQKKINIQHELFNIPKEEINQLVKKITLKNFTK